MPILKRQAPRSTTLWIMLKYTRILIVCTVLAGGMTSCEKSELIDPIKDEMKDGGGETTNCKSCQTGGG